MMRAHSHGWSLIVQYYRVSHQSLLIGDEREHTCKIIAAAVSSLAERKGIQTEISKWYLKMWKTHGSTDSCREDPPKNDIREKRYSIVLITTREENAPWKPVVPSYTEVQRQSWVEGRVAETDLPSVKPKAGETNRVPNDAKVPDTGIYDVISPLRRSWNCQYKAYK